MPPKKKNKKSGEKMPEPQETTKQETEGLSEGPKRGERGEYLPATYRTPRGIVRRDN